jgi:hypothetical protein
MIQYVTGGRWGVVLRGVLEAAAMTVPLMLAASVPIVVGINFLYVWTDEQLMTMDRHLEPKMVYLNVPFFLGRAALYFFVWILLALLLRFLSQQRAERHDPARADLLREGSAPGLLFYAITVTFAAVDWLMSIDPKWYSTIFGAVVAVGQLLPALALGTLMLALHARDRRLEEVMTPTLWKDLGNLLLAFTMLWAYMSYSQFFLIWSGNLPEETRWYAPRITGGWEVLGWALIVFYFVLPFALLLSSDLKRNPRRLALVASVILVMHYVHQYWLIKPGFYMFDHLFGYAGHGFYMHWLDPPAFLAVGGLWLAWFFWQLRMRPLVPAHHPALEEVPQHG